MTPPVTILTGCAYTELLLLPSNSVDCIITSPPYWGLRDYGIEPSDWPACSYIPMPGLEPIHVPAETSCLGLETTLHAFLAHLTLIFTECRRVLKPTGSAWVNMGDGYASNAGGYDSNGSRGGSSESTRGAGTIAAVVKDKHRMSKLDGLKPKDLIGQPWRVAFALQASGWYLRQDNIWHKPNPMPESIRDRATKSHEYVFHLTKSERYYFDIEAWKEKASGNTHARRASNSFKMPDGWDTSKGGHGSFHKAGREKGKPASATAGVKNNSSMDAALSIMPTSANKRSVWTVSTVAYSEAHYATYPPKLITPPLLASTSAYGCCADCGAPWQREVIKTDTTDHSHKGSRFDSGKTAERPAYGIDTVQKGARFLKTVGDWHPTCTCEGGNLTRPVVLDIFGGSGTTAQVALENGRHAILIERGPHNVELIHKRLAPFLSAPVLHLA